MCSIPSPLSLPFRVACATGLLAAAAASMAAEATFDVQPYGSSLRAWFGSAPAGPALPLQGQLAGEQMGSTLTLKGGQLSMPSTLTYQQTIALPSTVVVDQPGLELSVQFAGTLYFTLSDVAFELTGGPIGNGSDASALALQPVSGKLEVSLLGAGTVEADLGLLVSTSSFSAAGSSQGSLEGLAARSLLPGSPVSFTADQFGWWRLGIPIASDGYAVNLPLDLNWDDNIFLPYFDDFLEDFFAAQLGTYGALSFGGSVFAVGTRPLPVPEPASLGLMLAGLGLLAARRATLRKG